MSDLDGQGAAAVHDPGVVELGRLIDSRPIGGRQWLIIGLCSLVALLDGFDLQSIGLAAPGMIAQLHIPPPRFGGVFSAALAGLALGAFVLGPLADRIGRKGVLVAATIWFGVFTVATAFAGDLTSLLAIRFLAGLGLGGAMPSFISLVSEYVPVPRRATIVALLWAGFPLGGVVGGLLASRLIPAYGWPSVFLLGGVLPVVLALLLLALLPESAAFLINRGRPPQQVAQTLAWVFPGQPIAPGTRFIVRQDAMRDASVRHLFTAGRGVGTLLLWISFFFAFMILVTNSSWSPILLGQSGVPVAQSAIALAWYNFGSLFGSAAAGALITRLGATLVLPISLLLGAVAYSLIGWAAPDLFGITLAQTLFGLLVGCGSSGLIALAAIYYPSAIRSTGVGWATAMGRFGSFCGPLAVGSLVGAHWPAPQIFATVAAISTLGALTCAAMGLTGRRVVG